MQTSEPSREHSQRPWTERPAVFWTVLLSLCALQLLPIWAVRWLPMGDLGGHLELMDIMARHGDPATLFAQTYHLPTGLQPNTVALWLAHWLPGLGALVVAKLLMSLYVLGLPAALAALAKAFNRSPWLALLALPLTWNALVNVGFLNYFIALPLLLATIALAVQLGRHGGRWRLAGLTACLALLFFCHVLAHLIALGMAAFTLAWFLPSWRKTWRLLAIVPALPLAGFWATRKFIALESTETGRTFAQAGGGLDLAFLPKSALVEQMPTWGMRFFRDGSDDKAFLALVVIWLIWLAVGVWQRRRENTRKLTWRTSALLYQHWGLEVLTLCSLAAYFVLPTHMSEMDVITERVVVQILLLLAAWPKIRFVGRAAWLLVPAIVLSAGYSLVVLVHFQQFEREDLDGLPAALEQLPPRTKLAYLLWHHENSVTYMGPLWHLPRAIFVLHTGGLTDDSFAVRPYTPVQYRQGRTPVQLSGDFTHELKLFDYDYVLIRSQSAPAAALASPNLHQRWHRGEWWLFNVQRGRRQALHGWSHGGNGGTERFWDCPKGEALTGLTVQTDGSLIRGMAGHCQGHRAGPRFGLGEGATHVLACAPGHHVVGLLGRSGAAIDAVGLLCAGTDGQVSRIDPVGGAGGLPFERRCETGEVAVGIQGRFGAWADAVGLVCGKPTPTQFR